MIIDCIADLHGHYPELDGGDLLIVAGDLTASDRFRQLYDFGAWMMKQNYNKKVVIAGNHDNQLLRDNPFDQVLNDFYYLCDSGMEFEGLKIWGSPWTIKFKGMNPHCMAFTIDTEEELAEKWALIPDDVDILVTHSPPFTIHDSTVSGKQVGSTSLLAELLTRIKPKLHVFGHLHESYGQCEMWERTQFVNASFVNEYYQAVNWAVRVIL
jgi:Icc-related predicted phosphoesterase